MAEINNVQIISKMIHQFVPIFPGETTLDLSDKVNQFPASCDIAFQCSNIDENPAQLALFLSMLKIRLMRDGFKHINGRR